MAEKALTSKGSYTSNREDGARTSSQGGAGQHFGEIGEQLAANWLVQHGYRLLARNWRSRLGELDIVSELGDELVFVEVKARHGTRLGAPEEAVTPAKRRRLIRAAQSYLLQRGQEQRPYRIDVIAVEVAPSGKLLDIRHYPGGIESEG
ncbi:MAG: YraN family protein [Ktedonobacterales bacterium]